MTDGARTLRVLFFCTGNSCRSQMAEGWTRHLKAGSIEPYSAGLRATEVDPVAMNLMAAVGVDISRQRSKALASLEQMDFDYIVHLCDTTAERAPAFPGSAPVVRIHVDDPPALAVEAETEEAAFRQYIRVRDEIRAFVESLPEALLAIEDRDHTD